MKILHIYSNRTKKIKCFKKNDKMKVINCDKLSRVEDKGSRMDILVRWDRTSGNLEIRCPEVEIIYASLLVHIILVIGVE